MNSSNGEDNFLRRTIRRVDSFFNDDTTYYAASLSFFTIFSILPIIALLIAIISSFSEFKNYLDIFINYIFNLINPIKSNRKFTSWN
jgi:membrane protein